MKKPLPWLLMLAMVGLAATAQAAGGDDWRPTYDLVMRWVNFVILAVVLIKFGRRPIANLLNGRSAAISDRITKLENEKNAALAKVAESEALVDASHEKLAIITEKIMAQGEEQRRQIVAQAREDSQRLMDAARHRVVIAGHHAAESFRGELVDAAVAAAERQLSTKIRSSDNLRMADDYINQLTRKP